MPAWLLWLLPVPAAGVAAVVWTSWASRARGPVEAIDSVAAYDRFRQALTAPVPAPRVAGPVNEPTEPAGSGS